MITRILFTALVALAAVLGGPFLWVLAAAAAAAVTIAAGKLAATIARSAIRALMTWQGAAVLAAALAVTAAAHPAAVVLPAVLIVTAALAYPAALIAGNVRRTGWRAA